jgi:hypothetical protein
MLFKFSSLEAFFVRNGRALYLIKQNFINFAGRGFDRRGHEQLGHDARFSHLALRRPSRDPLLTDR